MNQSLSNAQCDVAAKNESIWNSKSILQVDA